MQDLEAALLDEVVGFAKSRLDELVNQAAQDAEHLLETLLAPQAPTPAQIAALQPKVAEIDGHLGSAKASAQQLAADLGGPLDVATAKQAIGHAGSALAEVEAAIQVVASVVPQVGAVNDALLKAVREAVAAVGDAVSGLVAQLGLAAQNASTAAGITSTPTGLRYTAANAAARPIPGPPFADLTLKDSTLHADLDFRGVPPKLGIELTTGGTIGLVTDGLVGELAPGGGASAEADLEISLDTENGLTLSGGAKHRVALPARFQAPGLDLRDLGLELPALPAPGAAPGLEVTGDLAGSLGPISAAVQGAGVRIVVDTDKLLAGQPAVSLEPIPPTGAGLRLDAAAVRGGGFLSHSGTEYGGALELRVGPVDVAAVGLVETQPFSLVVVIGVEFFPAIQLSFGFTLNAVGGLVAIERGLATEALRNDFSNGTADALLFPADPVGSAPTILNALREVFPPEPGGFVVGPMLELGWGAPVSFVTAKAGVLIALPDPKIVLLGVLRVAVPAPEAPIVDLRAAIYGEITAEEVIVLVDLSGSRIAGYPVAGQFGFYANYGEHPQLAFSAGGFHPAYHDRPSQLASLKRVSVDLSPPAIFTIRAEAYLALTSNSFQLGARVELAAEAGPVGAEGHLGFDALVVWSPHFLFIADIEAGVSLHAFGETFCSVDLHLHVQGPGPWTAHGTASISLLFFDVDLDAGPITWGEGSDPPADTVSPQKLVRDALSDPRAWAAQLPPGTEMLVTLLPDPANDSVLVHPLGSFEVRQRAIPLETTIARVGRHPVSEHRVNLGQPQVGGKDAKTVSHAADKFAPGEFLDLSDDEKLSRPAFEEFPSGLRMAVSDASQFGTAAKTPYDWETVYPHQDLEPPPMLHSAMIFLALLKQPIMAVAPAALAAAATNPYVSEPAPVEIADPGMVTIRDRSTLAAAGLSDGLVTTANAASLIAATIGVSASLAQDLELAGPGVGA